MRMWQSNSLKRGRGRGRARGQGGGQGSVPQGRGNRGRDNRGGRGCGRCRGHLIEEPNVAENQANHEQHLVVR